MIGWSRADAAELECILCAFVDGFYEHRSRCLSCSLGGSWCEHVSQAFEAILDWRRFRELKTRAQSLRAFEEAA